MPVAGTVGGVAMGCTGLVELKRRGDPALLFRETPVFGPVLVAHLAAVIIAFAIAPYTKFAHWVYRLLAIYKSNLDTPER